jgi:SAM-dependent methyltransferase
MENITLRPSKKRTYNKPLEFIHPDDRFLAAGLFGIHLSRYDFASQYTRDKVVLDIACGCGYGSAYLRYKGASRVVGGDISREAIIYARCYYSAMGVDFVMIDAQTIPLKDDLFDVVVSMETIEHLVRPEDYLKECLRVLKDDGIMLLSTPNKTARSESSTKDHFHTHEYEIGEFLSMLQSFFLEIDLYGQCSITIKHGGKNSIGTLARVPLRFGYFCAQRIIGGHLLVRAVTRLGLFRECEPVDISKVEGFSALLRAQDKPYAIDDIYRPDNYPVTVIAIAKCPKKQLVSWS